MSFDVAIIGAGPGGYTAADKAAKHGLSVVLFEERQLGGTCLNRGCIPTKALLHEAAAGVRDGNELQARRDEVVAALRSGIEKLMRARKVEVVQGRAQVSAPNTVSCNGETYEAAHIIIACGSEPAVPPIEGAGLPGVYTSDDLLEGEAPQLGSLVIVGGGVIGMEMAWLYSQLGAAVTVLEAAERILPPLDREIAQRVGMYAKKRGIAVEASARVERIEGEPGAMRVTYTNKKGEACCAEADGVLIATGRRAATKGVIEENAISGFDSQTIIFEKRPFGTSASVYVIGDARTGGIQLAHAAEAQARNVVASIAGVEPPVDEALIPSCVYLTPEVASVGLTEDEAKAQGIDVRCGKALTGANGKCLIEGGEAGYAKLVCDAATGVLLGAQLVCPRATDLIAELALAISLKATAAQLARVVHPHPTVSELIAEAARSLA